MNATLPLTLFPIVERAAAEARRALRREHGLRVSYRVLRRRGVALMVEQGTESGGHRPCDPSDLPLLRSAIRNLMVEAAVTRQEAR